MSTLMQWLHGVATPILAFIAFFAGSTRCDFDEPRRWPLVTAAAAATIVGAAGHSQSARAAEPGACSGDCARHLLLAVITLR